MLFHSRSRVRGWTRRKRILGLVKTCPTGFTWGGGNGRLAQ